MKELMDPNRATMTSNEIAKLTGKRHDNVMRDIRKIVETIGIEEVSSDLIASTYTDKANRIKGNYTLTKRGTMLLLTGYSDKLRLAVLDRFEEMENELAKPKVPTNFLEAMELIVVREKERLLLEEKIEEDKPKVSFADTIASASDSILIRDVSKVLGNEGIKFGQNKVFDWLRGKGLIEKNSTKPTQKGINLGLFKILERIIKTPYGDKISITTKVTGKGQIYIVERIKNEM